MQRTSPKLNHPPTGRTSVRRGRRISAVLLLALASASSRIDAQAEDALCTVSILNQTAYVQDDGTWLVPNVPTNMGPVRARVTCVEDGVTTSGESELFSIVTDRQSSIPVVPLGSTSPAPVRIDLGAPRTSLSTVGESVPLSVTARFEDGSSVDVSAADDGVTYVSTNPEVASIDADGLVVARASGRVFITALYDGTIDTLLIEVVVSGDSDGDGLPDDFELANGLDPNDPVDAFEDPDRDGLATIDEIDLGLDPNDPDSDGDGLTDGEEVTDTNTNPALFDTDGDGLSDGLELRTGSNPLDATSFNLAEALAEFLVTPPSIVFVADVLGVDTSRQLTVNGTLIDDTAIDLTSRARGTQYASSDLLVCNFGAEDGAVFAGQDGSCVVTVSNSGFSAAVEVEVTTFAPISRGSVELPGFGNNVDVSGDWAFVACGAAGLVVVDVSGRGLRLPVVAARLETPGNANDVKVRDGLAFVADGTAGLQIVDVTEPLTPSLLAALDTPGEALDVAFAGTLVLVADGSAGLAVVDATDPTAPALIASLDTPGEAKGVDADGLVAVVADGEAGLHVVDLADPANPSITGSVATTSARDVDVDAATAWLADFDGGLRTVDVSDPSAPRITASVPLDVAGVPHDVVKTSSFAFVAEVLFAQPVVPIMEADPTDPVRRSLLLLDEAGAATMNGTGLAVDERFVYVTASERLAEHAASGNTRLYVGQYLGLRDDAGQAPSVRLVAPLSGDEVVEGEPIVLEAEATDDVGVFLVRFLVDGEVVAEDRDAPFTAQVPSPPAPATLTVGAVALDYAGLRAEAEPVDVHVVARPTTSVIGSVVDAAGAAVEGAAVFTNRGGEGVTDGGGFFRLDGLPAHEGDVVAFAAARRDGVRLRGRSEAVPAVTGGFTDVGEIRVEPLGDLFAGRKFLLYQPGESGHDLTPLSFAVGDFNGDGVDDRAGNRNTAVGVLLGRGDATFEDVRTVDVGRTMSDLAAADLDGDGFDDLVALHSGGFSSLGQVSVLRSLGDGSFEPPRRFTTGSRSSRVAIADFNGDGLRDLAVSNSSSFDVSVLLGTGGGDFAPQTPLAVDTGSPTTVSADDFDGDSQTDLLVTVLPGTDVLLMAGRGDGTFAAARPLSVGIRPYETAFVDADGDGVRDLVVSGLDAERPQFTRFVVLHGRGDGTYEDWELLGGGQFHMAIQVTDVDGDAVPELAYVQVDQDGFYYVHVSFPGSGRPPVDVYTGATNSFRFCDLDGDGVLDLEVAGGGGVKVFRAVAPAVFPSYERLVARTPRPGSKMVAGDLNADGVTDLVQGGSPMAVLLGTGAGAFAAPVLVPAAHTVRNLWIADADRDGTPDLVTRSTGEIAVFPGRGDGTFEEPRLSLTPPLSSGVAATLANFDGDGALDMAVAGANDDVVLMRNRGDGTFTLSQSPAVGDDVRGLAAADFDGDGRLDLALTTASSLRVLLSRNGMLTETTAVSLELFATALLAFDANRDAHADLVVEEDGRLHVFLGRGDGTFTDGGLVVTDPNLRLVEASDVDLDGVVDLLVIGRTDDVAVYLGRGDGTFEPARHFTTGAEDDTAVLVVTELDGDGRPDLVVRGLRHLHFLVRN